MAAKRIICAISGGVDSAVAALLLKRKGFDVSGVFMRNWDIRDEIGICKTDEDKNYAERVCKNLGIPFHEVDLVKEYWLDVFEPMISNYAKGRTPNPDVLCNKHVKFNAFFKKCQKMFDSEELVIVTGHYAQTNLGDHVLNKSHEYTKGTRAKLLKAVDGNKDQTFFLHKISGEALRQTYFPVGTLYKNQVKEIAKTSEVAFTLERKESMGICFIGKRTFNTFIQNYIQPSPGRFVSFETGEVVGNHNGIFMYTLGQRSGLGGKLLVIVHKDTESGNLIVAEGNNHPLLFSRSFFDRTDPLDFWYPGSLPEQGHRTLSVQVPAQA